MMMEATYVVQTCMVILVLEQGTDKIQKNEKGELSDTSMKISTERGRKHLH